jgi:hypothetical protein
VHNKEQRPILSQAQNCFARFVFRGRIDNIHKRIEEYLTRLLKMNAMLFEVCCRFIGIPTKLLTPLDKVDPHPL